MKAIILCAGKSTRLYPLTITRPKPLLKIINKTIIEHTLKQLEGLVDEAILVVGYKKEMIIDHVGKKFGSIKITYVTQEEQLGTGHAVLCAKSILKRNERFLILPGDDLFSKKDIKNCLKHKFSILCKEVSDLKNWGIIVPKNGFMASIEEKPNNSKSNLASTSLMVVDYNLIELLEKQKKTKRGEIEIPGALNNLAKKERIFCQKVSDYWLPIGYPWHYLEANVFMLKKMKNFKSEGKIEPNAHIEGDVFLEEGAVIKSGSYVTGPVYIGKNTTIGPMAYIRKDSVIMDDCNIRAEVFDSVIMSGTTAKHHCYLGHSVVGEGVNIAAGTVTADYRHDAKEHTTLIKGEKVATGRRKLGAFIGDNVKTGINTSILPGRKLWPNTTTFPGEVVSKDKME